MSRPLIPVIDPGRMRRVSVVGAGDTFELSEEATDFVVLEVVYIEEAGREALDTRSGRLATALAAAWNSIAEA